MIRLMLINDFPLVSNLLEASLDSQPDMQIVRDCTPDEDLPAAIQESQPDVLLISGHFSVDTSLEMLKRVEEYDHMTILIIGVEENEEDILPYLEAGASGYVVKGASVDDLIDSIRSAHGGMASVSPRIARVLIERVYKLAVEYSSLDNSLADEVSLTRREREVLELVGENLSNADIAERLHVEEGTVKNHVHSILQKLDVKTRQDAMKYLTVLKKRG